MVRTNGAFVAGYELKGVLSYFATMRTGIRQVDAGGADPRRTRRKHEDSIPLRDLRASWLLFDDYVNQQRTHKSEVVALDTHRLRMWRRKEQSGFYFENRLHVYFIWDPRIHAKLYHSAQQNRRLGGFTLSQKKAIQRTRKEHDTYLAEWNQSCRY